MTWYRQRHCHDITQTQESFARPSRGENLQSVDRLPDGDPKLVGVDHTAERLPAPLTLLDLCEQVFVLAEDTFCFFRTNGQAVYGANFRQRARGLFLLAISGGWAAVRRGSLAVLSQQTIETYRE
ncbi:MAG: hypothetical protein J0M24_00465 [Verrucomicrobia bacterium]|nr:hypothetical protein [Verrucomicrobiota bacterium]